MNRLRSLWVIGILMFLIAGSCKMGFANGITISNLSRDSINRTLTFDLQWQNSWRLDSTSAPLNWDAAWVFVKLRECDASITTPWIHGNLSSLLPDHNFGSLSPVYSDGSGTGLDSDLRGVMLRRQAQGFYGNDAASTITLKVDNMLPSVAYNVRVLGIEMVFVPEDTFFLGSVTYSNAFSFSTTPTDASPLLIVSENAISLNSHAPVPNNTVSMPAAFPKGFAGFHLMKYEISQGQYADFLNSLAPAVQYERFPANLSSYRNQLSSQGGNPLTQFVSTRENRAQNYLDWEDLAAYLDWACLRPMTEMEYEKACRGPEAMVLNEYAWGTDMAFELTQITAPEDGTELPQLLPANAHYSQTTTLLTGGDGGYGPVRCGIFALPGNSTREQSGASYYGIMELSGNVWEPCVGALDITSTTGSVNFTGELGDGAVDGSGLADVASWPGVTGLSLRGGGWDSNSTLIRVSNRNLTWSGLATYSTGGRGGRR